jgi:hypothetical protein
LHFYSALALLSLALSSTSPPSLTGIEWIPFKPSLILFFSKDWTPFQLQSLALSVHRFQNHL